MDMAALQSMLGGGGKGAPNLNLQRGGAGTASAAASGGSRGAGAAASPTELRQHADHLWKFLDELAQSDPDGYKKFLAGQMDEMAAEKAKQAETEAMFTPVPQFALATRQTTGKGSPRTLYINICSSPQVPGLQTKDRKPAKGNEPLSDVLIPLSVGAIKADKDAAQGGEVFTSDVVFNPAVTTRALGGDMGFKLFLLELALQHVEQDESVTLHRGYKLLPVAYVGGINGKPAQQRTEAEIAREQFISKMKTEREEKLKNMATKNGPGEVLMPSRAKTAQAQREYEDTETIKELKLRPEPAVPAASAASGKGGAAGAPTSAVKKKVLIEDLTPDEGVEESLKQEKEAAAAAAAAAKAPSTAAVALAAKPAIALASTTKKTNSAAAALSSAASTAASSSVPASASVAVAAAASFSIRSVDESPFSSKSSVALSSDDLLSSLAALPVDSEPRSSWPYGSPQASMRSTESIAEPLNQRAKGQSAQGTERKQHRACSLSLCLPSPCSPSLLRLPFFSALPLQPPRLIRSTSPTAPLKWPSSCLLWSVGGLMAHAKPADTCEVLSRSLKRSCCFWWLLDRRVSARWSSTFRVRSCGWSHHNTRSRSASAS